MITATFAITLSGNFLPIQLIYGGKTSKSIPAVAFPPEFLLSANEKHYSNEKESLKMLKKIIIPFVEKERRSLDLDSCHPALLIMDVFKGQMTELVMEVLKENNIFLEKVPANLTYLFQPLDVQGGPNGYVKRMMKNKFTLWYADQISRALDKGRDLNNIEVSLKLSVVKPLHAKWIIEMYDHMTSAAGKAVCLKAWEVTGILGAVKKGLKELAHIDPFNDIDPLASVSFENEDPLENPLERDMYIHEDDPVDSESDYEDDDGNIFGILEDDMADL